MRYRDGLPVASCQVEFAFVRHCLFKLRSRDFTSVSPSAHSEALSQQVLNGICLEIKAAELQQRQSPALRVPRVQGWRESWNRGTYRRGSCLQDKCKTDASMLQCCAMLLYAMLALPQVCFEAAASPPSCRRCFDSSSWRPPYPALRATPVPPCTALYHPAPDIMLFYAGSLVEAAVPTHLRHVPRCFVFRISQHRHRVSIQQVLPLALRSNVCRKGRPADSSHPLRP